MQLVLSVAQLGRGTARDMSDGWQLLCSVSVACCVCEQDVWAQARALHTSLGYPVACGLASVLVVWLAAWLGKVLGCCVVVFDLV
jgi:hypothetical protein